MIGTGFIGLVAIPAGLGLFGFIEPCTIGSSLVFIKYLEGKDPSAKVLETAVFAATRSVFIGLLGVLAVLIGDMFLDLQRHAWLGLGSLYVLLGILLATGQSRFFTRSIGPGLRRLSGYRGSVGLGLLFGFNIPACAAPLLIALLAAAAASSGATVAKGFIALAVFGLGLSIPLVVAVLVPRARGWLERIASLSARYPALAGLVLIALGGWSIWFGLFADLNPAASAS